LAFLPYIQEVLSSGIGPQAATFGALTFGAVVYPENSSNKSTLN